MVKAKKAEGALDRWLGRSGIQKNINGSFEA
jgi:hypothetical protein